jgi:hypothetical protein
LKKKKHNISNTYIEYIKIIQIIDIRLFFINEEKFCVHFKKKFNNYDNNKKNLTFNKRNTREKDFLTHLAIDFFTSLMKIAKYLYIMIRISDKHFDCVKSKYGYKKNIKNSQIGNLNYKNILTPEQNTFYLKIYRLFHIFQINTLFNYLKQPKLLFFIENIITLINCSRLNILKLENKIYFFQREILTEIEIVKTNLFKYENHLENKLGINVLRGIKNLLKIIKDISCFKSKIFGLVIDLILVHKHFYKAIESVLSKYFTFIVVKNKKIIYEIINIYIEKIKTKIDFITSIDQIKLKNSFLEDKLTSNVFPILKTVFYRNEFEMLFKKLLNNIYFIQNSIQRRLIFQKNNQLVNLDGDVFDHCGHVAIGIPNQKISALEIVNLLKKSRFFFIWLNYSTERIKNIQFFLVFFFLKIKFLSIFFNNLVNLIFIKNTNKNNNSNSVENFSTFFLEIINKETLYVNFLHSKKKNCLFKKKSLLNYTIVLRWNKTVFNLWNLNIYFFYGIFNFIETCCYHFSQFYFNRTFKYNHKFYKNFFNLHYFYIMEINLYSKNLVNFSKETQYNNMLLIFLRFFFKKKTKFFFYFLSLILFFILKIKNKIKEKINFLTCLIKTNNQTNKKKVFDLFYNISKKNLKIELSEKYKNLYFLRKIVLKLLTKFNQLETDLFLINQTFDLLGKKKNEKIKYFLFVVSKNFSKIFNNAFPMGKAAIIIKYKQKHLTTLAKSIKLANVVGITILAKLGNQDPIYFVEQMSSGQSSIITFFFFISLRTVNPILIYIFDEIDANLDYINSIYFTHIIKQISSIGTQFLISTFNQKFILSGDKWFGISTTIKGSFVQNINKNIAIKFNIIKNKI